jgi:hypothetical protein
MMNPFSTQPFLDETPKTWLRDPALYFHKGIFHLFYTAVEHQLDGTYALFVDTRQSTDLHQWSASRRLTEHGLNFSSPGNILQIEDRWILSVQSYPIKPGELYGDDRSRLWVMETTDLQEWSAPRCLHTPGCEAFWARSPRQIDPYLVQHDSLYWCFYKAEGQLGAMTSSDLVQWREVSPNNPILSSNQTPDQASIENPCVIWDGKQYWLFFSPCRAERGIGVAHSTDLIHWKGIRYLEFPKLEWATRGITAAFVWDGRFYCDAWIMVFHGEWDDAHSGALGFAWSRDLIQWNFGLIDENT